ncbi:hypothetical protein NLI96_g815 [Meripilus lineatus]|uniref:Exonuclease 1 n=1 Tax=Meripilus lineatus TaxID=2056292 RepID=A0AAD5YLN3_9APHY|nr:hypothetical protein NLI96_g815 [Physisporinus lineatus]
MMMIPVITSNRHIIGWYRVIKELKESDVTALCVFDGKERSLAKKNELERRRLRRKVNEARGSFETDRLRRLTKLSSLVNSWQTLPSVEQSNTAKVLRSRILSEQDDNNDPLRSTSSPPTDQPPQQSGLTSEDHEIGLKQGLAATSSSAVTNDTHDDISMNAAPIVDACDETVGRMASDALSKDIPSGSSAERAEMPVIPSQDAVAEPLVVQAPLSLPSPVSTPSLDLPSPQPGSDAVDTKPESERDEDTDIAGDEDADIARHEDTERSEEDVAQSSTSSNLQLESKTMGTPETTEAKQTEDAKEDVVVDADAEKEDARPITLGDTDPTRVVVESEVIIVESEPCDSVDDLETSSEFSVAASTPDVDENVDTVAYVEEMSIPESTDESSSMRERIPVEELATNLAKLYDDYKQSIPKLESIPYAPPPPTITIAKDVEPSLTVSPDAVTAETSLLHPQTVVETTGDTTSSAVAREEYAMSRTQLQLTSEEGQFWSNLLHLPSTSAPPPTSTATPSANAEPEPEPEPDAELQTHLTLSFTHSVHSLAEKSSHMAESFSRRINVPTSDTYEESKTILRALRIPCIESKGPYEAEALAASIVLGGYADYVASEDSDVLIYEAPLLRNLSNRANPLVTISGSAVRSNLDLSRDAYIDFALLLGTDFSKRISRLGPSRAFKFIKRYGTIEDMLKAEESFRMKMEAEGNGYGGVERYLESIEGAREIFGTLPPLSEDITALLKESANEKVDTNTNEDNADGKNEIDEEVLQVLTRFGLGRLVECDLEDGDWDYHYALDGNFFEDNPSAS